MPLHKSPKCLLAQTARLEQLRADRAVEGLRGYLEQYECFGEGRDPKTSPIRDDELRVLVKVWKLHRQKNFWRDNTSKDDLVRVLEEHVVHLREQEKRRARFRAEMDSNNGSAAPGPKKATIVEKPVHMEPARPDISEVHRHNPQDLGKEVMDLEMALNHMKLAVPLLAALKPDLTELPDDCLMYMSRVGMVGAGKSNPALLDGEALARAAGVQDVAEDDESLGMLSENYPDGNNSASSQAYLRKQIVLQRNLASGLGNVAYREPSAVLGQQAAIKQLLELSRTNDDEVVFTTSAALLNLTLTEADRTTLLQNGSAVFVLFDLTQHGIIEVRENAATTLARLTMDPTNQVPLVSSSAHVILKEMFKQSNLAIERACITGVVNLASVPGATVADVVVETLMRLSGDEALLNSDESLRTLVCEAVLNMSILSCCRANIVDVGAMTILGNLLASAAPGDAAMVETRACVAQVICNLSTMKVNQGDMMHEGVVRMLASIVAARPPLSVLQYCAEAIAYHACSPNRHQDAVEQGAVPAVVATAGVGGISLTTKMAVGCTLAHLTSSYDCCPRIVDEGALPVLISLLDEDELVIKKDAVTALCNLLVHPETKAATIDSGIITALVGLSQTSDVTLNQVCAMALFNLSCSAEIHETILEQGGVQAIITLLTSSSNAEVVSQCIKAVFNLSVTEQSQGQIVGRRGVPVVVEVAQRESTPLAVRKLVASTLCNLSNLPEGRDSMIADDAVGCAIELSAIPSKSTKFACAGTLLNLGVAEEALDGGLVPAMKELAHTDDVATLLRVATCFAFLSSQKKARAVMCAEPGMSKVLNSMMRSGHEETQVESATCLVNMTTLDAWEWGTSCLDDFIVIALLRTNSETTKLLCTKVLFNVLVEPKTRAAMINRGVLYALMRIAQLHNVHIHQICVQAVFNLSCEKTMHPALHDNSVAPMLAAMTRVAQRVSMRVDLASALANLSSEAGHEQQLVMEGGLSVFKELIRQPDLNTKLALVRFLANVSTSEDVLPSLVADGEVLRGLLKLVKSDVEALLNRACLALCNITCARGAHKGLVDGGTIETLVEVLAKTENQRTIKMTVKALRNLLVCDQMLSEKLLVANGIPVLVKHMSDPQDMETCALCAKICFVIATVPQEDIVERLVDGGIMDGLKAMTTVLNDPDAKAEALVALCNVSRCVGKHEAIIGSGIVQAVCNLALSTGPGGAADASFTYNVAATLRNLTTQEANHQSIIRTPGAVKLLVDSARCKDGDTREHVCIALHNLCTARTDAGRASVGKQGGLAVLIALSEGGAELMKTFCGLALQSLSAVSPANTPDLAARLVASMLAIKDVDEGEPVKIVDANVVGVGDPARSSLLPGRTRPCWDEEPEATWSKHVESLLDLPKLPVFDPMAEPTSPGPGRRNSSLPGSRGGGDGGVEKPKARMMPHDAPELISGEFTIMQFPEERVLADPSFLRAPGDSRPSPRSLPRL